MIIYKKKIALSIFFLAAYLSAAKKPCSNLLSTSYSFLNKKRGEPTPLPINGGGSTNYLQAYDFTNQPAGSGEKNGFTTTFNKVSFAHVEDFNCKWSPTANTFIVPASGTYNISFTANASLLLSLLTVDPIDVARNAIAYAAEAIATQLGLTTVTNQNDANDMFMAAGLVYDSAYYVSNGLFTYFTNNIHATSQQIALQAAHLAQTCPFAAQYLSASWNTTPTVATQAKIIKNMQNAANALATQMNNDYEADFSAGDMVNDAIEFVGYYAGNYPATPAPSASPLNMAFTLYAGSYTISHIGSYATLADLLVVYFNAAQPLPDIQLNEAPTFLYLNIYDGNNNIICPPSQIASIPSTNGNPTSFNQFLIGIPVIGQAILDYLEQVNIAWEFKIPQEVSATFLVELTEGQEISLWYQGALMGYTSEANQPPVISASLSIMQIA